MGKKSPRNSGRYSPRAALVAVGLKVNSLELLEPVKQKVVILQKSIRHTPRASTFFLVEPSYCLPASGVPAPASSVFVPITP